MGVPGRELRGAELSRADPPLEDWRSMVLEGEKAEVGQGELTSADGGPIPMEKKVRYQNVFS